MCTINEIVKRHGDGSALFIVKIDIEGFESDLFASQTEWVDDAHVIVLEPHDWLLPGQATSRNFQIVLARHDFDILISGENLIYVRRESPETNRPPRHRCGPNAADGALMQTLPPPPPGTKPAPHALGARRPRWLWPVLIAAGLVVVLVGGFVFGRTVDDSDSPSEAAVAAPVATTTPQPEMTAP